MAQLPREDDTPFSLPNDTPEAMPIDYPELDTDTDSHEVYDEGLEFSVGSDPYSPDDDPIRSTKELMRAELVAELSTDERYTTDHDIIRRWIEYRYGHPAIITGRDNELFIYFEDNEPDVDIEAISWRRFFTIFEKNKLAFIYKIKTPDGEESYFYKFMNRRDVGRLTEARITP